MRKASDGLYAALVPRVGIEPTLLAEPDFESGASTNFTTEALTEVYQNFTPDPAQRSARRARWQSETSDHCMC